MEAILSSIIRELELCDDEITNIYNYGSWVYGTNHEKSDRDFMIVMNCKSGKRAKPLRFRQDFDYFHSFELHRLSGYDVTIHSCANFEKLLEKNYMLAVECVFYPNEFILRNTIDYKTIYLSKYYNPLRLKRVAFYENMHSLGFFLSSVTQLNSSRQRGDAKLTLEQFLCDAAQITSKEEDRFLKYLFHGIRYMDISEQLIRTHSIKDFKRASYALVDIKDVYIKQNRTVHGVLDYFERKSSAYKEKLNELLPTTCIEGTFKIFITVDHYDPEQFHQLCQLYNWKPVLIKYHNQLNSKYLFASFDHSGKYPGIVQQVESIVHSILPRQRLQRLKIVCSADLTDIPLTDIDKELFWDENSSYFEFSYKVELTSESDLKCLKKCTSFTDWWIMHDTCLDTSMADAHCYFNIGITRHGKESAFIQHHRIMDGLTRGKVIPLEVHKQFVVYDSNIESQEESTLDDFSLPNDVPRTIHIPAKYRPGCKNRKFFPRSSK